MSGLVTLLLGPSKLTGATETRKAAEPFKLSTLVSLAALVFAACLAAGLSAADDGLVCFVQRRAPSLAGTPCASMAWSGSALVIQLCGCAVLIVLSFVVSYWVNVNRFSLHALYRNRLVRAYLGSARLGKPDARHPDPFSHFDQADNLPMNDTWPRADGTDRRLLHVVNITLNTVSTKNLAWQERKAEPFTVTALHSGNDTVGYRPTELYGGGISLGTAMAISGAAVSPNMGLPFVAAGRHAAVVCSTCGLAGGSATRARRTPSRRRARRPGCCRRCRNWRGRRPTATPGSTCPTAAISRIWGSTPWSSGGCRCIVVSDAGCDPDCAFEDLGNAVRKIYIDFGISIDFKTLDIAARKNPAVPGFYCAVGSIHYPEAGEPGWLLYIKPGYQGVEPADIRSYALANQTFPHETTADQWFTRVAVRGLSRPWAPTSRK